MPAGLVFPFDFGYVNHTIAEDKQPLDVIVLAEFSTFPGCVMQCRIIGGIIVEQSEGSENGKMVRNDRLLAIPVESHLYKNVKSLKDLPENYLTQLKSFLENYNALENKKIKVGKAMDSKPAEQLIEEAKIE